MKRIISAIAVVIALSAASVTLATPQASAFSGSGAGTLSDPFLITSCFQFQELDGDPTSAFELTTSLDCTAEGDSIMGSIFGGSLDGNNNSITIDISINGDNVGLISYLYDGEISNLIVNGSVQGSYGVGGVVGTFEGTGTFTNVVSNVDVEAIQFAGGLIGQDFFGNGLTITNSSATGTVTTSDGDVGGLIGKAELATISGSFATGDVTSTNGGSNVGGFAGSIGPTAVIEQSYATGMVFGGGSQNVGGFVGSQMGIIESSYATGDISNGGNNTGGFVGAMLGTSVSNSYASGDVGAVGQAVGGFAGYVAASSQITQSFAEGDVVAYNESTGGFVGIQTGSADIENAYARGQVNGDLNVSGFAGYFDSGTIVNAYTTSEAYGAPYVATFSHTTGGATVSDSFYNSGFGNDAGVGATGKTIQELKTQSTYTNVGWDFVDVWAIDDENDGFPRFASGDSDEDEANAENDLNGDGIIDAEQDNVVAIVNGLTGKTIVIETDEGCVFTDVSMSAESSLPTQDVAFDYLQGLANFTAECDTQGEAVNFKMYYYDVSNEAVVLRKYLPATQTYTTLTDAAVAMTDIYGASVVKAEYSVIDGSVYDADGEVNGTIVDPAGLGSAVVGAPRTGAGGSS